MSEKRFDKIDTTLGQIRTELHKLAVRDETRLTRLETTQKGFVTIFTLVLTALTGFIIKHFN